MSKFERQKQGGMSMGKYIMIPGLFNDENNYRTIAGCAIFVTWGMVQYH